ncbi:MAG: hypothetical protein KA298_04355 [Paludibacteraceae bacterium]|nr:hypothetical protein [Paludibacteraceae bacterium]
MARLDGLTQMTGSMANISMYKLHGHDKIIIRTKGGPSKYHIKTKPQFAKLRNNNTEWSTCTKMAAMIRTACSMMKAVEDYPVSGALNALCKHIQKLDTDSEHGKRVIYLTKHTACLEGFSFGQKQVLESVIRVPIEYSLDRTTGMAHIHIPTMNTEMQLYNFRKLPYYRIIAQLASVCDLFMTEGAQPNRDNIDYLLCWKEQGIFESEWLPTTGIQPKMDVELIYMVDDPRVTDENGVLLEKLSLVLSMGIEFGKIGYGNAIEPVKYAGTGKILKVV